MLKNRQKIEQIAGLALIGAIVIGCGLVLWPFMQDILWAAILCFTTWPLMELMLKWFKGRKTLAAVLMTVVLMLVLFIPFFVIGLTFVDSINSILQWIDTRQQQGLPPPPGWIEHIPIAGQKLNELWTGLAENREAFIDRVRPWIRSGGMWLLKHSLNFGQGIFHLAISLLVAFLLYRDGQGIAGRLREWFQQISGDYAHHLIDVVKTTVQKVVYGAIGAGLMQAIVAGIGFVIADVPSAMLLILFVFFLSFVPAGPPLIWVGAAIWLFEQNRVGWGIFMLAYGLFAISSVDNLIKPYIISRGSKLPFIIMVIGVLGGIMAFGFIGVFLGPTLLAVGYSLTQEIFNQRRKTLPIQTNTEHASAPEKPSKTN